MKTSWKSTLLTAALGAAALLGGVMFSSGSAQARDRCFDRIRREEWKLERDIERHGYYSRQARHRRQRIREFREGCRFEGREGGWWDGRGHRRDGDWDRDDHWRRHRGWHHRRDRRWQGHEREHEDEDD